MNFPNKLTIARLVMTVIFMVFLFGAGLVAKAGALLVFTMASLTDMLDGYIARKYHLVTDFGKLMDPIADKALVLSAFIAFVQIGLVPAWMVVVIASREFVVTGLRLLALSKKEVLAAQEGGKHKTISQMVAIFLILIFLVFKEAKMRIPAFWTPTTEVYFRNAIFAIMLITITLTIISGISFLMRNKKLFVDHG